MNYKIVSNNQKLIQKAKHIFATLGYNESIHIQEVDIWLIDTKTINEESLISYKNKDNYSHVLFVKDSADDLKLLLKNSFTRYIDMDFSHEELSYWCKFLSSEKKDEILYLSEDIQIDFSNKVIKISDKDISLTSKEILLLKELSSFKYISTKYLANSLALNSTSSVRSVINRIREKLDFNIFEQSRSYGYKLISFEKKEEKSLDISYIKELEEQNTLMQSIVDSSPIFIVTFIHRQLYCINKSFRDYLGVDIVKELWDEESGDFFKLIEHKSSESEELKDRLFSKGEHPIKLYEINDNKTEFIIETFYFENLDKHLFVFKSAN